MESRTDADVSPHYEDVDPKLFFALGLAGLTYAVGLAGFWSIY